VNPGTGQVLDEVLLSAMKAPMTYTREDIIEINTHSGYIVMASILDLVLQRGARLAEPGEFTKRAYLSGRIDLTQAEAVIDIINSRTQKSLEIATSQIKGNLKKRIEFIRGSLIDILTQVEAAIDFPEDVGDVIDAVSVRQILEKKIIGELSDMIAQYDNVHFL
jgi:tRNA modification GTPase